MDLVALADFNAVVAHRGFGPASRATGQPKATLSRRVRGLEAKLGVRLIERGSRVLRLTEEGRALHARTVGLLAELDEIGQEIAEASGTPRGRLRVSVPAMLAGEMMGGLAAQFVARYPAVKIEIVVDDRFVDLVDEGYDLVVRANPPPDSALVGQCIRRDTFVVVAHPDMPRPACDGAPQNVPAVVQIGTPRDETWTVDGPNGPLTITPDPTIRVSSIGLVRGAVYEGAGIGLLPLRFVARDLDAGDIVSWGTVAERRVEVWALHASTDSPTPRSAFSSASCGRRSRKNELSARPACGIQLGASMTWFVWNRAG